MPNSSRPSSPPNAGTTNRTNAPQQQEKTRGSGHTEHESHPAAAPKSRSQVAPNRSSGPVAAAPDHQAKSHAHGQDADDQLASGKTPPGGTNLAGGKSNAPDRRS